MMEPPNIKKKLSPELCRAVEECIEPYWNLLSITHDKEGYHIYFTDKSDTDNYYFGIRRDINPKNNNKIKYDCKPASQRNFNELQAELKLETFQKHLKHWLENLKYSEEPSILNDPILRGYRDEFYQIFKLNDEEADFKGFNFEQQLALKEQLNSTAEEIEKSADELPEKEKIHQKKISDELRELGDNVTKETKNSFLLKFSIILAKSRKFSLSISELIFKEFVKLLTKKGFNQLFSSVDSWWINPT